MENLQLHFLTLIMKPEKVCQIKGTEQSHLTRNVKNPEKNTNKSHTARY